MTSKADGIVMKKKRVSKRVARESDHEFYMVFPSLVEGASLTVEEWEQLKECINFFGTKREAVDYVHYFTDKCKETEDSEGMLMPLKMVAAKVSAFSDEFEILISREME